MAEAWETLESIESPVGATGATGATGAAGAPGATGTLELRRRGQRDFLILLGGRVLMNSAAQRSELALAELAASTLAHRPAPRVLIGGLGMGLTLRAALDHFGSSCRIEVAELNPQIVAWCQGPLAPLTGSAVDDPGVEVHIGDVAELIATRAREENGAYDAILLDLYEGPHAGTDSRDDPFYGTRAIEATRRALTREGVFGVWSEAPDRGFEKRLGAAGFEVQCRRPGRGGLRHAVYIGKALPFRSGRSGPPAQRRQPGG